MAPKPVRDLATCRVIRTPRCAEVSGCSGTAAKVGARIVDLPRKRFTAHRLLDMLGPGWNTEEGDAPVEIVRGFGYRYRSGSE